MPIGIGIGKAKGNGSSALDEKGLFRICDVKIVRHVKVRNITNPYIDTEYYDSRQRNKKYERGFRDKDFAM